ncbi:MAG: di-trans,poly-cis-decaprenylcistransferase [Epulopiscium sp. Nele67-Bin001]|nr:MAG: di-trans,poly-cis-decaprenylcistransferase [Epulopiscium sp. Nuni2H_MBin001]OON90705.1 MAG: di-trans,poly-cis-decaprenylcistransferase [Epulopiscium sp. Nele67-Bin001]
MHIAIIMDGNGRWASKNNLSRNEGHKIGSEVLQDIIEYAKELNIDYITAYAFSTENWSRSTEEVSGLMKLLENYLARAIKKARSENVKVRVIGKKEGLSAGIIDKIDKLEESTKDKTGTCVTFAINYGGRDEIVRACSNILKDMKEGVIVNTQISQELISQYLDTSGMPDPDLLIRTSGEMRTSNFLPWQLAYTEFYFLEKMWPEFTREDFDEALRMYSLRNRRFGKS